MTFEPKQIEKARMPDSKSMSDDQKWQAVISRDAKLDGHFFFSVATTGVYCRPSCGARQPRRENVAFHASPLAAEAAGFRPCKRCKPDETPSWNERSALVARACRFIEEAETPPTLDEIAATAGLSPYHFHRVFKDITGVTPKAYAVAHRSKTVRGGLKDSRTVTEAIYDAGYNANSRFYEKAEAILGMSPKEYRAGGLGMTVHYTVRACSLGLMLVGATERGVCTIQFGDDPAALEAALRAEFPGATISEEVAIVDAWVDAALALADGGAPVPTSLPLDIQGTAFQQKVWQALQTIPMGETRSYKDIAESMGEPKAVRAVARACAKNHIAIAIPCHRVVRSDGALSGYRWGKGRKKAILDREAAE